MSEQQRMTKGEREDLLRLIKQREKVCKSAAEQRSSAMLADFENKISAVYAFDKDEVWSQATAGAAKAFDEANAKILHHAKDLGIPEEFSPKLHWAWARRGENETRSRRDELRRVAKAEIDRLEKVARVTIEAESVKAQTEIIANGLTTDAANAFMNSLPAVETMMPMLDVAHVEDRLRLTHKSRPEWMQ